MTEPNQPPENAQIKTSVNDLEELIRDELYAFELDGSGFVTMARKEVGPLATRIARRAIVGH
jgi:hypothetical protein